jgi:hypothetical protein
MEILFMQNPMQHVYCWKMAESLQFAIYSIKLTHLNILFRLYLTMPKLNGDRLKGAFKKIKTTASDYREAEKEKKMAYSQTYKIEREQFLKDQHTQKIREMELKAKLDARRTPQPRFKSTQKSLQKIAKSLDTYSKKQSKKDQQPFKIITKRKKTTKKRRKTKKRVGARPRQNGQARSDANWDYLGLGISQSVTTRKKKKSQDDFDIYSMNNEGF